MSTMPIPPELRVFEKDVGTWTAEVEVKPPGAPPQRSQGTTTSRMVAGRWLVMDYKNETSGFEGHGIYGWDAQKQAYVGTWVDTMTTFLVLQDGTWDPETKTMTFRWSAPGPAGKSMNVRQATQQIDADTQVFRSYISGPEGKEHEMMTVTYRRKR